LFKLGFFTNPEASLKQVFLEFSLPICFGLVSGSAIFEVKRNTEVYVLQISSLDSFYSKIYFPRKLGFLVGPYFSLKQVFSGKLLYLKLKTSKLSEMYSIGYGMDQSCTGTNFKL
jgi:hypothetical protein